MIVYTKYPYDARVRREAEMLAQHPSFSVNVLVPKENAARRTYKLQGVTVSELDIRKYHGSSITRYLISYIKFLFHSLLACSRLFFQGKIDVVHVHNMPNFLVFSAILPRIFRRQVILDIHDTVPETYAAKFKSLSNVIFKIACMEERLSCALANRIVCVNHVQSSALVNRGISSNKIIISMNAPDQKIFRGRTSRSGGGKCNNKFRLAYHGTITQRLGLDLAIQSVARLKSQVPNLEFHILGNGDYLSNCKRLASNLNLQDRIYFHQPVPVESVPRALEGIDLGLVPNPENEATNLMLPVKMLEYIALGIPVVAPKLKAIEYYFSDKMVSYFEPGDVESMANAILRLSQDEKLRKSQAQSANAFLDRYGWGKHQMGLIRLYQEICNILAH